MMVVPQLSVVIPCYQDNDALKCLLTSLRSEIASLEHEILVVDGARSGACEQICHDASVIYIPSDKASRGYQIVQGAEHACGDVFWFLHADATIQKGSATAILEQVMNGKLAGFFRFKFEGQPTFMKRFIEDLTNFRSRFGGNPYGDQGIFVERQLYLECGGHEPISLFDEARLVRRLRSRRAIHMLDIWIGVDPRRWERDGYIRRSLFNRFLAFCYMLGVSVETLAKWYKSPLLSRNGDLPAGE